MTTITRFMLAVAAWLCVACGGPSLDVARKAPEVPVTPAPAQPAPSGSATFDGPMDEPLTLEYRACQADSDCVLAQNGCCDCANGGRDIAVSLARLDAFRDRFRCGSGCTERAGNCGKGTVTCEASICVYREPP